jgi:hypothetical protein
MKTKLVTFCICISSMILNNKLWSQENLIDKNLVKSIHQSLIKLQGNIKPQTHILTIALANNQYPLIIKDPSVLLAKEIKSEMNEPNYKLVSALNINYQFSILKNYFLESSFNSLRQWTYFKTNEWIVDMYQHVSGFSVYCFSFGGGIRIVGENKFRFFDIHSGLTIGITDNPKGKGQSFSSSFYYQDGNENIGLLSYSWQYQIISRVSYGFYIGLSKDIRITDNLFATFKYQNQFGKRHEFTNHTITYNIPTLGISETVRASNTLKGQMMCLGLRWVFSSKKEKNKL